MKDRILGYLDRFAKGKPDPLADELKKELGQDDPTFRQNCNELQSAILHQYDQFSISTIDGFFQKVIRSFTRESGLIGDYRLEVDTDAVLDEVVNNLIDELEQEHELTRWVVEFSRENMENDKGWDVRKSLKEFAGEIFNDQFKAIEKKVRDATARPEFFIDLRAELWKVKKSFLDAVSKPAREALDIIGSKGWVDQDFKFGKNAGLITLFDLFAHETSLKAFKGDFKNPRSFTVARNWPGPKNLKPAEMIKVAEDSLVPRLVTILDQYDNHQRKALSAEVALQNMYAFGILSDIARKLQDYKTEHNLMLLADAPVLLNGIIQDSDTPFIYERIGSFYRNYLIDEFQDTSGFQWDNFFPLLTNGLDQGYPSLVVGDVKQAIYRWRGGDLSLLEEKVEQRIGQARVVVRELDRNFRSAKSIVSLNNSLFKTIANRVTADTGSPLPAAAYRDVIQESTRPEEGFVRINFPKAEEGQKWSDKALEMIPKELERLQEQGVALNEIAILVRMNSEGQKIAAYLLQYKNSGQTKPSCKYDVVSNESLRMDGAASVNLLLSAMKYLLNPEDPIARAQLSFEFSKLHEPDRKEVDVFSVTNLTFFESQLPEAFTTQKLTLRKLSLFELTETLIEIFRLGKEVGELAYVQGFQDLVLEFYSRERNDIAAFLEWWEDHKNNEKTSIKISGEVDAVQILTIHKAKGLQFKYVIIPFCSWKTDHNTFQAPNLWVKSNEAPFSNAGYLPVSYSAALKETFFQKEYEDEKVRVSLDSLNMLYVALTRAENGLIITAPSSLKGQVGHWLYQGIQQNAELQSGWKDGEQMFVSGVQEIKKSVEDGFDKASVISLSTYLSSNWREKLVIRHAGKSFFDESRLEQRAKINYGIHLHAVLSRIAEAKEIPARLIEMEQEGLILESEKPEIQKALDELMAHPVVGSWFSSDWKVQTEVSILLPGGAGNRIDRLMTKGDQALIIDFKTGEKTKSDKKQVLEYIQILKQMNFSQVVGHLLYTRDMEVVSLPQGKAAATRKKDERQLGLDL